MSAINYRIITHNNLVSHMWEVLRCQQVAVDSSMAAGRSVEPHWGIMEQLGLWYRQVDPLEAYKTFLTGARSRGSNF